MYHYNAIRERRRKEFAQQYVDYQCNVLYYELCGECHLVDLSTEEKEDMIRRAKKPILLYPYQRIRKRYNFKRRK